MSPSPIALVIGGSGFIGRATSKALVDRGLSVVVADLSPGGTEFPFKRIDVAQLDSVCRVVSEVKPQIVVNLAYLLADETETNPGRALHVNLAGMQNVFDACAWFDVHRCVYASSLAVYGDQSSWGERALAETDAGQPVRLYGWHKVLNEVTAKRYEQIHGTQYVSLRISTVYGAGRETGLSAPINSLLDAARTGSRGVSPWPGDTEFNLIHVDDVADAFATLGVAATLKHRVYNSGGETVTIAQLAEMVRRVNPQASVSYADPAAASFPHCSRIDWSRLRTEFDLCRPTIEERLTPQIRHASDLVPS